MESSPREDEPTGTKVHKYRQRQAPPAHEKHRLHEEQRVILTSLRKMQANERFPERKGFHKIQLVFIHEHL